MIKQTVQQYADEKGVSVQSVYQRVKRNTLKSVIEDGVTYVLNDTETPSNSIKQDTSNNESIYNDIIKSHKREVKLLKKIIKGLEQELNYCRNKKDENYHRLLKLYEMAVPKQLEHKKDDSVEVEIIKKKKGKKKGKKK